MIPKKFPEGKEREEFFKKFFTSLQSNLFLYNKYKSIFERKIQSIPSTTLEVNNFDTVMSIKEKGQKEEFLRRAYLLGFSRGKEPYSGIRGKVLSEYDQAGDYINLLFYFDETLHQTITDLLQARKKLGPFYRYIGSLGK